MSIGVALEELQRTTGDFPNDPYLLTVGDDGRSHSVAVAPRWEGEVIVVPAGRTTRANATTRPLVVLLWPPPALGEFSLIVDATARTRADDLVLEPTRAVLHRRAPTGGNDCAPVL